MRKMTGALLINMDQFDSNMDSKVRDEIIYQFPNFNVATVEV